MKHSSQFIALVDKHRPQIKEVSNSEVASLRALGAAIIDVREESEYAAGFIPEAVHIGKGVLERDVEKKFPDKQQTLILYCGGGMRSILAAAALQDMGYRNVISLSEGWRGWNEAKLPTDFNAPESAG